MGQDDFPDPGTGFVVTHFLVVADQDRSRDFYRAVFGATVVEERDPVVMKIAHSWLILIVGGGPTDYKPTVTLATPADPDRASAFLNIRVADIGRAYREWSARLPPRRTRRRSGQLCPVGSSHAHRLAGAAADTVADLCGGGHQPIAAVMRPVQVQAGMRAACARAMSRQHHGP